MEESHPMSDLLMKSNRKVISKSLAKERTFWKNQLAGSLEKSAFPTDFRLEVTPKKSISIYSIPKPVSDQIKKMSQGNHASLTVILAAGLSLMLQKYTRSEDILLGQAVDLQSAAELMIAAIPLRCFVDVEASFRDHLNRVRNVYADALNHQTYPLDILAEELGLPEEANPYFDVAIQLENLHRGQLAEQFPVSMLFSFLVADTGIDVNVHFDENQYLPSTIDRIMSHYMELLNHALFNLDTKMKDITMITEQDKELVDEINSTFMKFDEQLKLVDVFERQAAATPDALAIVGDLGRITYGDLNAKANRLARTLRAEGVGQGKIVAIMVERSAEMMVGILAILKAGGAYLPIDPNYPKARIEYILTDSGAGILLTQNKFAGDVQHERVILVDSNRSYAAEDHNLEPVGSSRDLAYVIYTSGSTGNPKGALIENRSAINRIAWMQNAYPIDQQDVILQKTPISFDVSVWELFWWMFKGAAVCMLKSGGEKDPEAILAAVDTYQVTTMHFVPSMLSVFLDYIVSLNETDRLRTLKLVFASGEALTVTQVKSFNQTLRDRFGAKLINLYGPTEATVDVSHYPCSEQAEYSRIFIGKPIDNIRLYIVNEGLQIQPIGVPGELCIAGVGLARGYLHREDMTKEKFVEHPFPGEERIYRTGDLARWDVDGQIEYLGRIDTQVKVRGFRIELGEIEEKLRNHPAIRDAVVIARDGSNQQKYLCGYVIRAEEIAKEEISRHLSSMLPEYMVPTAYVYLDAFPITPNGKLDRKALPDPAAAPAKNQHVAPRNEQEQVIAQIWGAVLGIEKVGITDDFFTLGGNSIHFISVLSRMREKGLDLTFQQLFQFPTIEQLTQVLATQPAEAAVQKQRFEPFEMLSQEDIGKLPEGVEDAYPMGMLQTGMIYHTEMAPEIAYYHDLENSIIHGVFDAEKFEQAFRMVVEAFPILRTSFHLQGYSQFIQMVHQEVPLPLEIVDLRGLPEQEKHEVFEAFMIEERHYRFQWGGPGMIRIHIHLFDDFMYRFNFSYHNSTVDGWSKTVLYSTLFTTYYALLEGKAVTIPQVENHFRNFIGLEQAALHSEETQKYWSHVLSDYTFNEIPRLDPSLKGSQTEAVIKLVELPEGLSDRIIDMARSLSVPVKNVLMAAHIRLLSILSGYLDVTTGYEQSGRPELEGADGAMGVFLNTIPLRMKLSGGSWADLIRHVHQTEAELLPHRRYPMAKMKQDLGTTRPLYETAFNFTHFARMKKLSALKDFNLNIDREEVVTEFVFRTEVSQDWITDEVKLGFHYHANVLTSEQANRIGRYFVNLLEKMVTNPSAQYLHASILPDEEQIMLTEGTDLSVLDQNQMPVPVGTYGEVCLRAEHGGWVRTGIAARWKAYGLLEVLGKVGVEIEIDRYRINPDQIEQALLKSPAINRAAVVDKMEAHGKKRLVAFYEAKEEVEEGSLTEELAASLAEPLIPSYFVRVDAMPIDMTGRVDKAKLKVMAQSIQRKQVEIVAQNTELVNRIAQTWADVLGVEAPRIGVQSHFFELGGNSLNAILVVAKSGGLVSLMDLLKYPVLGELANAIGSNRDHDRTEDLLLELSAPAQSGEPSEFTLICFPYAGGNAINFKPVAEELMKLCDRVTVYALELPGHDYSKPHETRKDIGEIAELCMSEIKEKVKTPFLLWGHSGTGSALAMEVAKRSEQEELDVKGVFIAGKLVNDYDLQKLRVEQATGGAVSDIVEWLASEESFGELRSLDHTQAQFIAESYQHDAICANRYFLEAFDNWGKLRTTIFNVIAVDDPVTQGFEERYQEWELFTDQVVLKTLSRGGHFFINTSKDLVAELIMNVWRQNHAISR
jgi:amino acid adenylation domain-containing protein